MIEIWALELADGTQAVKALIGESWASSTANSGDTRIRVEIDILVWIGL